MVSLVSILEPFASDDRQRMIRAALTLLNDSSDLLFVSQNGNGRNNQREIESNDAPRPEGEPKVGSQFNQWRERNSISEANLDEFLHRQGEIVSVIALPLKGKVKSKLTVLTYVMVGMASFMKTGDSKFSDEEARTRCQHFGCYDQKNHATTIKGFGNLINGNTKAGWTLTAPGQAYAAKLIKDWFVKDNVN